MNSTSREYAKFKRTFVGPKIPRKIRIAMSPAMPVAKYDSVYQTEMLKIQQLSTIGANVSRCTSRVNYATPKWADLTKIQMFYDVARQMTINTGITHHVDHIVPLNNPIVSGLHVENNLRIITDKENLVKSNLFLIE